MHRLHRLLSYFVCLGIVGIYARGMRILVSLWFSERENLEVTLWNQKEHLLSNSRARRSKLFLTEWLRNLSGVLESYRPTDPSGIAWVGSHNASASMLVTESSLPCPLEVALLLININVEPVVN